MIQTAIVEDDSAARDSLIDYLKRMETDDIRFCAVPFCSADDFLEETHNTYDLILMDIRMDGASRTGGLRTANGMEAARRYRERDSRAVLIFITSLAKYAVEGYSVEALDFIVKPVSFPTFQTKITRALNVIASRRDTAISVYSEKKLLRLHTDDIIFVEVIGHLVYYHTAQGTIPVRGSLSKLEQQLQPFQFLRCHNCYLVNPRNISVIDGMDIEMTNGEHVPISHPKKKTFLADLAKWMGE